MRNDESIEELEKFAKETIKKIDNSFPTLEEEIERDLLLTLKFILELFKAIFNFNKKLEEAKKEEA